MITFNFKSEFVDSRVKKNLLERITIDLDQVYRYLSKSFLHLEGSQHLRNIDLDGSYQILYDSARKSLTAIFALNGLKPTSQGGHAILHDVIIKCVAQEEVLNFRKFDRMRKRRNFTEYLIDKSTEMTLRIRDEDYLVAQFYYFTALEYFEERIK